MKKILLFFCGILLIVAQQFAFATVSILPVSAQSSFLFGEIAALRDEISSKIKVVAQSHYPLFESATLRQQLPENTLVYLRIPNFWGTFAASKETFLKPAFTGEAHQQQINQLEQAIYKNLLQDNQSIIKLSAAIFLHHIRSPLELAIFLPEANAPPMMANALFSVKLDFVQMEDLNDVLNTLIAEEPSLELTQPLNDKGFGMISTPAFPVFLHYDVETHLFFAMLGAATDESAWQNILAAKSTESPMYAMEKQVDTSQQGLFFWLNTQKIIPAIVSEIPPSDKQLLEKLGLLEMNGLGLGWGSANGKGRLKLIVDTPKIGYRRLIPTINNQLNLTTAGNPNMVMLFSLPTLELLQGVEEVMEKESPPEEIAEYQNFKQQLEQTLHFSMEEFLQFFGQQLIVFNDELGDFIAIQAKPTYQQFIEWIKTQGGKYEVRQIEGQDYHHLSIHFDSTEDEQSTDEVTGFINLLLDYSNMHFYWMEEEGYLIFAKIPQLLIERHATLQRINMQQWLAQKQRQSVQTASFLFSLSIAHSPRYFYQIYLTVLNYLADIAQTEIDLFALPTAQQLNLPENGGYGIQLDLADSQLAFEMVFDNNPLEFAFNSSTSIVIVGILAAIAVPAYVDYTNKIKVSEALAALSKLKTPALEFYATRGLFPTVEELGVATQSIERIEFESPATYTVIFGDDAGADLKNELISLSYDENAKTWQCITTVKETYINSSICQPVEH